MALTVVIGGTGNVGQGVVPALLASGQQVRVLTRNPTVMLHRARRRPGPRLPRETLATPHRSRLLSRGSTGCTWPPRPPINKRNSH